MEAKMAPVNRIVKVLDDFAVPYRRIEHRDAFTATDVARESHVAREGTAKVVIVRDLEGRPLMAVLPASARLDLGALERAAGRSPLRLATEREMDALFPDCEPGAMPPFGGPYNMPTYVDACLRQSPEVYFQAGNHHETFVVPYAEYERLSGAVTADVCMHVRRGAA
jgi:Ala-tRNA(Pro) deacylase